MQNIGELRQLILKKEFYFIRHGQTDHNILKSKQPEDISLNDTGRAQAQAIEPIIATLPVKAVCSSPMKRVQETKALITPRIEVPHHTIDYFSECSGKIWREMVAHGMFCPPPAEGEARLFMDAIREGINQALLLPGSPLIVAHGGTHWALCCMMGITSHEWAIGNCALIHFHCNHGKWTAKKL